MSRARQDDAETVASASAALLVLTIPDLLALDRKEQFEVIAHYFLTSIKAYEEFQLVQNRRLPVPSRN